MRDQATHMSDRATPRFLFLAPQGEEFDVVRQRVTSSLQEAGIKPVLWDEVIRSGATATPMVADTIQQAIERADIVIADITGNNPNVLFEMGYAFGARKNVLPIVQRSEGHVISDLGGRLYLVYDLSKPAQLSDRIKTFVLRYLESGKA